MPWAPIAPRGSAPRRPTLFPPRVSAYDTGLGGRASRAVTATPRLVMADSTTSPSGTPSNPAAIRAQRLEAARDELAAASVRGEGGRQAMRQYSNRMDALIQQLFAEAGSVAQPVAVFALGGYGRR